MLGVKLGWVEGIEVNVLGLVAGLDLRHPAVKLPAVGRVGFEFSGERRCREAVRLTKLLRYCPTSEISPITGLASEAGRPASIDIMASDGGPAPGICSNWS